MPRLLLDTNALIWLLAGDRMEPESLVAIADAQRIKGVLVSPISAWEASVALTKANNAPNLGGLDASAWFEAALGLPGVKLATVTPAVALEAARVPAIFGNKDPGDCLLIATARIRRVPIVTRDSRMWELAKAQPDYLRVIWC